MNRRDQLRVVASIGTRLGSDWHRHGTVHLRRTGIWVQILGINPGAGSLAEFIPYTSLDFLPLDLGTNRLLGGCATARFHSDRYDVDRWISVREFDRDPPGWFVRIAEQFAPPLLEPLTTDSVNRVLDAHTDDWPCVYGRCVEAALEGNVAEMGTWLDRFRQITIDRPLGDRLAELQALVALAPDQLRAQIRTVVDEKGATFS